MHFWELLSLLFWKSGGGSDGGRDETEYWPGMRPRRKAVAQM